MSFRAPQSLACRTEDRLDAALDSGESVGLQRPFFDALHRGPQLAGGHRDDVVLLRVSLRAILLCDQPVANCCESLPPDAGRVLAAQRVEGLNQRNRIAQGRELPADIA